ncbi:MAG: tRNA (adenosine(37)-N6)-threonylcarbamoyltransferase complex ATPase subunit type 1 TsaE [Muribaculaceae bacterium]|nr:tRNA (adenosine(37)-N6)-threonylcarbamoyltransferase complex ATPase subunit type 1 TsaE [Muribaculaceae bacterium]
MKQTIKIDNLEALPQAVNKFIDLMGDYTVFAFHGEMGAGKTTFIRELARQLGVDEDLAVNSPSFSLINEYRSDSSAQLIYHFDLYRLENIEEAVDIGVEDYLESGALCLIEWPDVIDPLLPLDTVDVILSVNSADNSRIITIDDHEND